MKRTILALVVLVGFSVVPPASAQKPPKQPGNLTISTSPEPVRFGKSVTISGKLTGPKSAGKTIQLREDPFPFDLLENVATVDTNAQGDYSFLRTPSVNTRYQTRQGGNESKLVTVTVRPRISFRVSDRTPRRGRRIRLFGRVCPEHDGALLRIQRRIARGQWRTVARTQLRDLPGATCSAYSRRVRPRRDVVLRLFLAADADHADGFSRRRRIDVH